MTVPPITTASFDGAPFPTELVGEILNIGLQGAPVFSALTPRITSRASLTMPTGSPDGFDWRGELEELPTVDAGDDAAVYSPAKIGGLILLSNESLADASLNITSEVARLISESMASKADSELVYGAPAVPGNAAAPTGFYSDLTAVDATSLRGAVVDAAAAILTAGGTPSHVLLSPSLWASEMTRRETTPSAVGPLFDELGLNLSVSVASTLKSGDALVFDQSGTFALTRSDYSIEVSREAGSAWSRDAVSLRVLARLAVAIPAPAKHARSITVTPEEPVTP